MSESTDRRQHQRGPFRLVMRGLFVVWTVVTVLDLVRKAFGG